MSDRWIKLDVDFPDHPKILEVGPNAAWLFLTALCWSRRYLTDGFISDKAMGELYRKVEPFCGMDEGSPQALCFSLLQVCLLERVENDPQKGPGYLIHDYQKHQQTKQTVQDRHAELSRIRAEAGRKGGLATAAANASANRSKIKHRDRERALNPPTPLTGESKNGPGPALNKTGCTHTRCAELEKCYYE